MKTKPKYFIVESDLNNPLWFVYIKWINETYNQNWAGDTSKFYGYDGNKFNNGTDGCDLIKSFENNPILLTLNQWYQLFIAPKKIYSISEIENNLKLIIYLDSEKEYKQLSKFINRLCPWYGKRCYSLRKGNYSSSSSRTNTGSYDKDSTIITILNNGIQLLQQYRNNWK